MADDTRTVDELVKLSNPQGEYNEQIRARVREIGESLFREGGDFKMRQIHGEVAQSGSRMHARILEGYWGGIGDWLS